MSLTRFFSKKGGEDISAITNNMTRYSTKTLLTTTLPADEIVNVLALDLPAGTYISTFYGRRDQISANGGGIFPCIHDQSTRYNGGLDTQGGFSITYIFTLAQATTVYAKIRAPQGATLNTQYDPYVFQAIRIK